MKIKWTLYRKIQIIIAVVLIFVFAVTQLAMARLLEKNITAETESKAINTSVLLQKNLEVLFSDANTSLEFLNTYHHDEVRSDDDIRRDLRQLTRIKESVRNAFVVYNDGTFVLEPEVEIPADFDPRTRDYYKAAYESREVQWSQPYLDMATNELVITSALYIQFNGIDGVIGVDINLKQIPEILKSSHIGDTGYTLLVSEDDWIVADSSLSLIDKPIDVIDDPEFTESNIITGVLETSKGTYFLRRLNQSNMRLIAFLPHSDISRSVSNTTLSFSVILLIAFLITTTLTHIFAKRLMYPIEQLKDTMKASEISDNLILLDVETNDEINTLIQGYNRLAEHVNEQNEELVTLSSDLIASEKELQNQYAKVSDLAYSDYLTGLPNRVKFEEQAKLYIGDKKPFAMFYVDLDNFKYINDTYGHNYGDVVLQIISKRLKDCCRGEHFGARLSGDEFGVLIMSDQVADIQVLAVKLLALINEPIYYKELEFIVTGSLGISIYPDDGHYFEDLLSNADIAMYEAKSKGANNYLIFCQDLRDEMIDRVMLESQLFNALDNNELYLCYQPLIDFKTKTINGFEALARWENEHLGFVPPTVFIPIAEKNLTINPIGHFVLEEAIKVGVELYVEYGRYYEMNVNVSVIQLHLESFVDDVLLLLKTYNYPPEYLNLEITESIALEANQNIQSKLEILRSKGIALSLDDFGSGYSSLNHLLNVDLTHLKIDRLIIMEASKDPMVYKLIHGIVEFAHAIGLKVIAEGIEDVHMEMLMQEMTIDFAQGYLYSKPVKKSNIAHIISQKF